MKPFIKWVGGKRQLLPIIKDNLPEKYNRYFEPFIGGGALFFDIEKPGNYISDINKGLINTYQTIADKNKFNALIDILSSFQYEIDKRKTLEEKSEYYYDIRSYDRKINFETEYSSEFRAGRFIFLNKTCFNGVQRENSKGYNNVPYGKHLNPTILNKEHLLKCHLLLKDTEIVNDGFESILDKAKEGDLVYFDPPYVPLPDKLSFTKYSKGDFTMENQKKLRTIIDSLHTKGVYVMISNSYSEITTELYSGYNKIMVDAKRMINRDGDNRQSIKEILVTTYPVTNIWDF